MLPKPRIFIHCPLDHHLSAYQLALKESVLNQVRGAGFEPQEFNVSGLVAGENWTFDAASRLMDRCQGAVILALPKYELPNGVRLPSEFAHVEGTLAISKSLPTLIITEQGVPNSGITLLSVGLVHQVPPEDRSKPSTGLAYFDSQRYRGSFDTWAPEVRSRSKVFFGYCSRARAPADAIMKYLRSLGVEVVDWAVDFHTGATIMDQFATYIRSSRGGLFLFTRDDALQGDAGHEAPRDNVVFEAGFCMASRGPQRTIIIREDGAKMPDDLGGSIYIALDDRGDIASIEERLRKTLETAL